MGVGEMIKVQTKVVCCCGECMEEVYTCDLCNEYLKEGDDVVCELFGHFCCDECKVKRMELSK